MVLAPARVDAVMLEARATRLFRLGLDPSAAPPVPSPFELELEAVGAAATLATVRGACTRARAAAAGTAPVVSVVVRPHHAAAAARALAGSAVRLAVRLDLHADPTAALSAEAQEVELPLDAGALLAGRPADAAGQLADAKRACAPGGLKVILDARELGSYAALRRAADLALAAGADFLKTARGPDAPALPAVALLLCDALRERARRGGARAGLVVDGEPRAVTAAGYAAILRETMGGEPGWAGRLRFAADAARA